jgi:hypothetical protein
MPDWDISNAVKMAGSDIPAPVWRETMLGALKRRGAFHGFARSPAHA